MSGELKSKEPDAPYDGFEEDMARHRERAARVLEAAAEPLPGPLRAAFAGEPGPLPGGFTLQPVTAGLITVLVRIGSPLIAVVKAYSMGKTPEAITAELEGLKPDPEAMAETVFCFVTPAPRVRALLARGRPVFREAALQEVADKLSPVEMAAMEVAIGRHYAETFRTAVSYEAAAPEGGGSFFSNPPAAMTTGSAGG